MSKSKEYSEIELLAIIQEHAEGNVAPAVDEIHNDPDAPSKTTYARHFGSWTNAVEEAGLIPVSEAYPYDREDLLEALRDYHAETGEVPSSKLVRESDQFPPYQAFCDLYGGIKNALVASGVTESASGWTSDEIIEHMQRVGDPGDPPHGYDLRADEDAPSPFSVRRVFGSIRDAAQAAGYDVERGHYGGWPESDRPDEDALIERIDRYVADTGETPALEDVRSWDGVVPNDYTNRWGDWASALHAAGYPAQPRVHATPGGHPCSPNGGREVDL